MRDKVAKTLSEISLKNDKGYYLEAHSKLIYKKLTKDLDEITGDFDRATINEIALWKVARYPHAEDDDEVVFGRALTYLNAIKKGEKFNNETAKAALNALLDLKGVQLPMASTILSFKNPKSFQIIDSRVYRVINNGLLPKYPKKRNDLIQFYFDYLIKLRAETDKYGILFERSDRVLFVVDKQENKDTPFSKTKIEE